MRRTRLSLSYVATYLTGTGLALIFAPDLVLKLLFSNRQYEDVFPRFCGVLMVGLGLVIVQLIRKKAEALYPATLAVRAFIVAAVVGLYFYSRDPFFLVVIGVVALGMAMTGTSLYLDSRAGHNSNRNPSCR